MAKVKILQNRKSGTRILYMTQLALISAIIILMAFTPLGYFRTPVLSITLLTIPVAVGAVLLGPGAGAFLGGVFGVTSIVNAVLAGGLTGMLLLINPIGALFTMLVPRIMEGWLSGLLFLALKNAGCKKISCLAACLSCPILNTVLFTGSLAVIFYRTDAIQGLISSFGSGHPFMFALAFVGMQGLIETVVCSTVASALTLTLGTALKSS